MNAEGWNFFAQNFEQMEKEKQMFDEEAKHRGCLFHRVFSTPDGQKVLDILESVTVKRSNMVFGGNDGLQVSLGMSFREGENNLFRYIQNQIKNGEEPNGS